MEVRVNKCTLKNNETGEILYPKTSADMVLVDDNGTTLDTKLIEIDQDITDSLDKLDKLETLIGE
jgi:hypothetical protein